MGENKTKPTKNSVLDFLENVSPAYRKQDAFKVLKMMEEITSKEAVLWGPSLIGFDQYHYKYASGREGDFFMVGFSPRKTALTIYIMPGFSKYEDLLYKLGKYKLGKSCLYIKKLEDVDWNVLHALVKESYSYMKEKFA
jgi:hypothetical protein